jgi:hypothetical protein
MRRKTAVKPQPPHGMANSLRLIDEFVAVAAPVTEKVTVHLAIVAIGHAAEHAVAFAGDRVAAYAAVDADRRRRLQVPLARVVPLERLVGKHARRADFDQVSGEFAFQDAVLVGAREGYYGECKFSIDLDTPSYLKMDRNSIKGLFGKFNPSSGDLVLSKNGELLGIMANNTYCLRIRDFKAVATFRFRQDLREQHTGQTLARFASYVISLPFNLQ